MANMHTLSTLPACLDFLSRVLPPAGVVHAGAGLGLDAARYAGWDVPTAVFVEAEEGLHAKLAAALPVRPGWFCRAALLSDRPGERVFHVTSNPGESGVLPTEALTGLWRNLKTVEQRRLSATTLELLLSALAPAAAVNWAVIDCLPALPILRGAGGLLGGWDVVAARVVLDGKRLPGQEAGKEELDSFLAFNGFRCVAIQEERQPAIGCAVYVRDWKIVLGARVEELKTQAGQLARERDTQATLVAERQAQIEQAVRERDEQARLIKNMETGMEDLKTSAQQRQARIAELEALLSAMESRQQKWAGEMAMAEGQIELIKDLLLLGPKS